jgi:hypothetical protein
MKLFRVAILAAMLVVTASILPQHSWASTRVGVGIAIGVPAPLVGYAAPVYYPPAYYAPPPVYGPPAVYAPATVVWPQYGYYRYRHPGPHYRYYGPYHR